MKPRDFLNFFKTKSGKLVLFVAIFGGGLMIFSVLRDKSRSPEDIAVAPARTNVTDKAAGGADRSSCRCSRSVRRHRSPNRCRW
ncbi:MAG: hypothetical protein V9H26_19790 [Verrucomicrobiota bacterium]